MRRRWYVWDEKNQREVPFLLTADELRQMMNGVVRRLRLTASALGLRATPTAAEPTSTANGPCGACAEGNDALPSAEAPSHWPDPPTTSHAERRGEPGEGYWAGRYRMPDGSWSYDDEDESDGLVWAGEFASGVAFFEGEFVESPKKTPLRTFSLVYSIFAVAVAIGNAALGNWWWVAGCLVSAAFWIVVARSAANEQEVRS